MIGGYKNWYSQIHHKSISYSQIHHRWRKSTTTFQYYSNDWLLIWVISDGLSWMWSFCASMIHPSSSSASKITLLLSHLPLPVAYSWGIGPCPPWAKKISFFYEKNLENMIPRCVSISDQRKFGPFSTRFVGKPEGRPAMYFWLILNIFRGGGVQYKLGGERPHWQIEHWVPCMKS